MVDPAAWRVPETLTVMRKRKQKTLSVDDYLVGGFSFAADGLSAVFSLEAKPTGSLRCDLLLKECRALSGIPADVASITRIAQA